MNDLFDQPALKFFLFFFSPPRSFGAETLTLMFGAEEAANANGDARRVKTNLGRATLNGERSDTDVGKVNSPFNRLQPQHPVHFTMQTPSFNQRLAHITV